MAFSNGFDITKVEAALLGRIGWREPTDPEYQRVDEANAASTSGRYFNDGSFHPLVDIRRIFNTQENSEIDNEDFNIHLTNLHKAAIMKCLNSVFNKPQLIEQKLFFETTDRVEEREVENSSKFVGFAIRPPKDNRFTIQVKNVSLYFTEAKTFYIYLFHSSKKAYLQRFSVTTVANDLTMKALDSCFINHMMAANVSGVFYLGYFQDDLGTANAIEVTPYANGFNCLAHETIEAPALTADTFDKQDISFGYRSYGLNAEVCVFKDFTQSIIDNAHLFDEAIGLTLAVNVIEQGRYSLRSNSDQRATEEQAMDIVADLNLSGPTDEKPLMPGLKARLERELKRIHENFFFTKSQTVNLCSMR